MEVNTIRPFFTGALNQFWRLDQRRVDAEKAAIAAGGAAAAAEGRAAAAQELQPEPAPEAPPAARGAPRQLRRR